MDVGDIVDVMSINCQGMIRGDVPPTFQAPLQFTCRLSFQQLKGSTTVGFIKCPEDILERN